jgi:hypothetical protein
MISRRQWFVHARARGLGKIGRYDEIGSFIPRSGDIVACFGRNEESCGTPETTREFPGVYMYTVSDKSTKNQSVLREKASAC